MLRKSFLLLALAVPPVSVAAGLGDLQVSSYLGEPFAADLVISRDPAEDVGVYAFSLGDATDYARLDLSKPAAAEWIRFGEPRLDQGAWQIQVTSRLPINDLVLDLVIVMRQPGAVESRHYPVLLDFPGTIEMPEQAPAEVRSAAPAPAPTQVSPRLPGPVAGQPSETSPIAVGGSIRVRRGDTLYGIARRYTGERRTMDDVADLLFTANPDAFINGNRNLILAGAELQIPVELGSASSPPQPPRELPVTQPASPPRKAAESDRVRLRAPPGPEEISDSLDEWLDADKDTLAAERPSVDRDLAFARTEIETYRRQNENLKERIATLEQRVRDLRRLMELRGIDPDVRTGEEPARTADDGVQLPAAEDPVADTRPGIDAPSDRLPEDTRDASGSWFPYLLGLSLMLLVGMWFFVRSRRQRRPAIPGRSRRHPPFIQDAP